MGWGGGGGGGGVWGEEGVGRGVWGEEGVGRGGVLSANSPDILNFGAANLFQIQDMAGLIITLGPSPFSFHCSHSVQQG